MLHRVVLRKPDRVIKWAYGVTTVPQRRHSLLPRTLESLKEAGFPSPRLYSMVLKSSMGMREL